MYLVGWAHMAAPAVGSVGGALSCSAGAASAGVGVPQMDTAAVGELSPYPNDAKTSSLVDEHDCCVRLCSFMLLGGVSGPL